MGLIVGPDATLNCSAGSLQHSLSQHLKCNANQSLFQTLEGSISSDLTENQLRVKVSNHVGTIPTGVSISNLKQIHWNSIMSFSWDRNLELAIQDKMASIPGSENLLTVTDLRQPIPPRTVPSFKMLGVVDSPVMAIVNSDYLKIKSYWQFAIRSFLDSVKSNPILVIGMQSLQDLFLELLAIGIPDPRLKMGSLIFLNDDVTQRNTSIPKLIGQYTKIYSLNSKLGPLVEAAKGTEMAGYAKQSVFDFTTSEQTIASGGS